MQRGRLEVLDEHVALRDESHEQLALLGKADVEGARALAACAARCSWRGGCRAGPRDPAPAARTSAARAPSSHVGRGAGDVALRRGREHVRRLDSDHLGAEVAEERGEVGARPHRREVEHADAAQRRYVGIGRARPAVPGTGRCPFASVRSRWPRRGAVRRSFQPPSVSRYGAPGSRNEPSSSSSACTQKPRWWRWSATSSSAGSLTGRDRPPRRLAGDGDLFARPFEQPGIEDAVEDLLRLGPHERVRAARTRPELVAPEHGQHLAELLGRHHHRHVAVGAGEDAERQQRVAARGCHVLVSGRPWYSQPRNREARDGADASASTAEQSTSAPTPVARARSTAASAPSAAV